MMLLCDNGQRWRWQDGNKNHRAPQIFYNLCPLRKITSPQVPSSKTGISPLLSTGDWARFEISSHPPKPPSTPRVSTVQRRHQPDKCKRNQSLQNARGGKSFINRKKRSTMLNNRICSALHWFFCSLKGFQLQRSIISHLNSNRSSLQRSCQGAVQTLGPPCSSWQSHQSVQNLHFIKDIWEGPFKNTLCSVKINHFMLIIKVTTE